MPTYQYCCHSCGINFERVLPIAKCKKRVGCPKCRRPGTRVYAGQSPYCVNQHGKLWPMKSDGAGVHPSQCELFEKDSAKKGVPTEFDRETGQAIFTSPSHRRRHLRLYGLHDNCGYD